MSSPPQQNAVVEAWAVDLLVFGQALCHWATLSSYAVIMIYFEIDSVQPDAAINHWHLYSFLSPLKAYLFFM